MALHVLAYNLKRVMNIMGIGPLIAAPLIEANERPVGARRRPFAPLSGRIAAGNRKSRPLRPREPNKSTKPKNRRDRPSKPTGPSHGQNSKCFYTAWTPSRHLATGKLSEIAQAAGATLILGLIATFAIQG